MQSSSFTGHTFDKIFADLCGKPVLQYSLDAFGKADCIDEIIVVTRREHFGRVGALPCAKIVGIAEGGKDRAESVMRGINRIDCEQGKAVIHDGARPLVTPELIERVVAECPAVPGVAVKDTIKAGSGGFVRTTLNRDELFAIQTPQVFYLADYRRVNGSATDDSALIEQLGVPVKIVAGDERNIKITTQQDLRIAEMLISSVSRGAE
jgi:2-C-methyl-D-erythritol 4-phosphate cytidylyltransferase